MASLLASEFLLVYLERAIQKVNDRASDEQGIALDEGQFVWTQTKSALVELAYGLILTNSFNHGEATLNGLIKYLEKVFNIQLVNFYDTFKTVRQGDNRTLYMDRLKDSLLKKMDDMLR
jgi:hypothetical protein